MTVSHTDAVGALMVRLSPRELVDALTAWRKATPFCEPHGTDVDQALVQLAQALNVADAAAELATIERIATDWPPHSSALVVGELIGPGRDAGWPHAPLEEGASGAGAWIPGSLRVRACLLDGAEVGAVAATVLTDGATRIAVVFRFRGGRWEPVTGDGAYWCTAGESMRSVPITPTFAPNAELSALLHRARDTRNEQIATSNHLAASVGTP